MSLIALIILLVVLGVALNFLPMDATIKRILYGVIIFALLILFLGAMGLLGGSFPAIHIGR